MESEASRRDTQLACWLPALALALFAAAYEVGVRQTDAYLGPGLGPPRSLSVGIWLASALVGVLLGRWALFRVQRRGALLVRLCAGVALGCAGSGFAWFWAFQTPAAFAPVALALPGLIGLSAGGALGALLSAGGLAYRELEAARLLLSPLPMLAGLAVLLSATLALSYLGLLRAGAALGIALGLLATLTPRFSSHLADAAPPSSASAAWAAAVSALALALAQAWVPARFLARYAPEIVWVGAREPELVVTSAQNTFSLFEAGYLRVTSTDAYRYAEAVVHPLLSGDGPRQRVLVLGAPGGFVEQEALRYPDVREVVSVGETAPSAWSNSFWPGAATRAARADRRLRFVTAEILPLLEQQQQRYDRACVALPEPGSYQEGKLYSRYFYQLLAQRLDPRGSLVVASSSRAAHPKTNADVIATLQAAGLAPSSYEAPIPLLGALSFSVATLQTARFEPRPAQLPRGLRYLDAPALERAFALGAAPALPGSLNTLDRQLVVETWQAEDHALGR